MATHNATHQMKTLCSTCSLRELCLPVGLMPNEFSQLDAVIRQSRRLKKGEYLFRAGEPFTSLFAIRAGFFKTTVASQEWTRSGNRLLYVGRADRYGWDLFPYSQL